MRKLFYISPEIEKLEFSSLESVLTGSVSDGSTETMVLDDDWSFRRDWE